MLASGLDEGMQSVCVGGEERWRVRQGDRKSESACNVPFAVGAGGRGDPVSLYGKQTVSLFAPPTPHTNKHT